MAVRAQDPVRIKTATPVKPAARPGDDHIMDPKATQEEISRQEARLARQFRDFEAALLRLAQRLETSSNPQDKEKAAALKKAIEKAAAEGQTKFSKLVEQLNKAATLDGVSKAMQQNEEVARDIQAILDVMIRESWDRCQGRGDTVGTAAQRGETAHPPGRTGPRQDPTGQPG